MGQIEVYEWLKLRRQSGDDAFYSVTEIAAGVRKSGLFNGCGYKSFWAAVAKLEADGYLEVKLVGQLRNFRRIVRIKEKYAKKNGAKGW